MKWLIAISALSLIFLGTNAVLWTCSNDDDCSSVKTATCSISNLCQCPVGYVFSEDVSKCLKESLYGENCESSNQCSHMLTGSKCTGVCECAEGYTYIRGRCRELIHLNSQIQCKDDVECFFGYNRESVVCHENKCKCAKGFYQRSDNICRRISNVNEPCIVHQDCNGDSLECINLLCKNSKSQKLIELKEIGVQTSLTNVEMKNVSTSIDNSSLFTKAKKTENDDTMYGKPCTGTNSCTGLHHSVCIQGLCRCQNGYYMKDGLCKAEIGEIAETPELCETSYNYETKKCGCELNRFANNTLRECLKPSNKIGFSCTQHAQCSPFGAAHCVIQCQCQSHAVYNEATQLCVPKDGLGAYCQTNTEEPSNNECDDREPHSICINNECVCKENYIQTADEHCAPGNDAPCSTKNDCGMDNSDCIQIDKSTENKVCKCNDGYLYVKNSENCLKKATQINDDCSENEQCKPLLGPLGKCVDEKCTCEDHLQYKNGLCLEKKELGETCKRESECVVAEEPANVECRNAVCECKFGFQRDVERQICRRPPQKNSSGRPSIMKVITLLLTSAAVLITGAALKEAYYT